MIIRRWKQGRGRKHKNLSLVVADTKTIPADFELTDLYVSPECRGKGWARRMMDEAMSHLQQLDVVICLRAYPHGRGGLSLPELLRFYESYGFKVVLEAGAGRWMSSRSRDLRRITTRADRRA